MAPEQLNELINDTHNWHYISSPTGLVNPNDSPNGNQIYHLYSTGKITHQKGAWAYLQRSEFTIKGDIVGARKMDFKLPVIQDDDISYAILTQEECDIFRKEMEKVVLNS